LLLLALLFLVRFAESADYQCYLNSTTISQCTSTSNLTNPNCSWTNPLLWTNCDNTYPNNSPNSDFDVVLSSNFTYSLLISSSLEVNNVIFGSNTTTSSQVIQILNGTFTYESFNLGSSATLIVNGKLQYSSSGGNLTNNGNISGFGNISCYILNMNGGNLTGISTLTIDQDLIFVAGTISVGTIQASSAVLNTIGTEFKLLASMWNSSNIRQGQDSYFNGTLHLSSSIQYPTPQNDAFIYASNGSFIGVPSSNATFNNSVALIGSLFLDGVDFLNNGELGLYYQNAGDDDDGPPLVPTYISMTGGDLILGNDSDIGFWLQSGNPKPSLTIDVGGNGKIMLGGTMTVWLEKGFTPSKGDKYPVITSASGVSISGSFSTVSVRQAGSLTSCKGTSTMVSASEISFTFGSCGDASFLNTIYTVVGVVAGVIVIAAFVTIAGCVVYRRRRYRIHGF